MPAVFCNCETCKEARRLGGKNIRTRSQALVNDELLIDFPADTYFHFLTNGIEGDQIRYLLVTHPHSDHLYPAEFEMRRSPFAHQMRKKTLDVYCGAGAIRSIEQIPNVKNVDLHKLTAYQPTAFGDYTVTALPARHMDDPSEEPFIYIIEGKDATLLYANDTGYFFEEVFDYIEKEKLFFDCVSFDCTHVDLPCSDRDGHMGIDNNLRVNARLEKIGATSEKTVKIINHFSHNGNPLHHRLEELVRPYGWLVSYDGLQTDFKH
jgi:phosphoribosyl 1,2-cyclic phosphate phosphodiesterase